MKATFPIALAAGALLLAGCHTMKGAEEDVSSAGSAITGSGSSGSSAAAPNQASGISSATVQHAQSALHSQGLYNGPIDGVLGPETQSAVAQYQQKKGLPATGQLDTTTLRDLTGSSSP